MGDSERMSVPGEVRAWASALSQHRTLSGWGVVDGDKYGSEPCSSILPPMTRQLSPHLCTAAPVLSRWWPALRRAVR